MQAVALEAFDQSPTIVELDTPSPASGELLVRVRAASINGFDVAVANGYLNGLMEHRFPVVLGKDFAGDVEEVGDGVAGFAVGDRVFGVVSKQVLGDGSLSQYVTVPAEIGVAPIPEGVTYTDAAVLGLAGTAALDSVSAAALAPGSVVLVAGATGGVGQQAVQFASHAGATVVATIGSDDEAAAVVGLGAASTVDYTADIAAQVREIHPDGVDVVLHFAGDANALAPLVKSGGALVSTIVQDASQLAADNLRVVPVFAAPTRATLERLARGQADGTTTVAVQRVYELADAPQALSDFAAGTRGKLLVTVD